MLVTYARQDEPRLRHRADPAYWHPAYEHLWAGCPHMRRPLGDFIVHLAYGPIVTGAQPPRAASGVALVNQGQIDYAGVNLDAAVQVPEGCAWDRATARLRPGDLVVARSGEGSLGKNRCALFLADVPAVVGSFVDLVRLEGIEAVYVSLFLKTRFGWAQIHRLLNGVATPNVSFPELRGLQIALPPEDWQQRWRDRYLGDVHPLHQARAPRAEAAHRALVAEVEGALMGRDL